MCFPARRRRSTPSPIVRGSDWSNPSDSGQPVYRAVLNSFYGTIVFRLAEG